MAPAATSYLLHIFVFTDQASAISPAVGCGLTFSTAVRFRAHRRPKHGAPPSSGGSCHAGQAYNVAHTTQMSKHVCYKETKMHLTKFFKISDVHVCVPCQVSARKGKSAREPFSPKPQPLNSPGQRRLWSFSIFLGSADEETVAPEGPTTDGSQSSWRAGKCLCGCGARGWGPKALPHSPALKLHADITPHCKPSPRIRW